ncbi:MAG: cytochrome c oxidase subunit II [Planctomycetes bacterium]|nr:cytochrome c oxidase subunit II [Planctomycetota bacterium]
MLALLIQDPAKINYIEKPAPRPEVDAFGQLEKLASTFHDVDGLFYFTYAVCIFFFVLITGVLVFSCVKYRRKTFDQPPASNTTHNTPLEVVWTVIPLIIVMVMFAWGFAGSIDMTTVPYEASRNAYKASAKQWNWTFSYPNDAAKSYNEVWMRVGKPAQFTLESSDVLHAFYVPAMRVKRDIIPGRFQTVWFTPTDIGEYHLFCAEYCGENHSTMYARVHVVSEADYLKRPWDLWEDDTPEKAVKSAASLYSSLCSTCHSINGAVGVGPTWKGLFVKGPDGKITGKQRDVLVKGEKQTITVDDAYIMESVRSPDAKRAAEFPNGGMAVFPPDQLDDRRLKGIIEFMKSLAEK